MHHHHGGVEAKDNENKPMRLGLLRHPIMDALSQKRQPWLTHPIVQESWKDLSTYPTYLLLSTQHTRLTGATPRKHSIRPVYLPTYLCIYLSYIHTWWELTSLASELPRSIICEEEKENYHKKGCVLYRQPVDHIVIYWWGQVRVDQAASCWRIIVRGGRLPTFWMGAESGQCY